jgi:hypothetical protein
MLVFKNITGKKEAKTFNHEVVMAVTTKGEFRLTPKVQQKLDIRENDSIVVLTTEDPETRKVSVYLAKGLKGEPQLDENGKEVRDGRGRVVYKENTGFGALTRPASEGSSLFKLTAAGAWNILSGKSDSVEYFTLGEGIPVSLETELKNEAGETVMCETVAYELIFKESKPAKKRAVKAKVEGEENNENNSQSHSVGEAEDFEEEDLEDLEEEEEV